MGRGGKLRDETLEIRSLNNARRAVARARTRASAGPGRAALGLSAAGFRPLWWEGDRRDLRTHGAMTMVQAALSAALAPARETAAARSHGGAGPAVRRPDDGMDPDLGEVVPPAFLSRKQQRQDGDQIGQPVQPPTGPRQAPDRAVGRGRPSGSMKTSASQPTVISGRVMRSARISARFSRGRARRRRPGAAAAHRRRTRRPGSAASAPARAGRTALRSGVTASVASSSRSDQSPLLAMMRSTGLLPSCPVQAVPDQRGQWQAAGEQR